MSKKRQLVEEALTKIVIGAFYEVYNTLGYGFREYIYALAMERELIARGLKVEREVWVTVMYKGRPLAREKMDMLVENRLILETKSRESLPKGCTDQLFSYLHGTIYEVGMLLHFGPEAKFYPMVHRHPPPQE
jgi:GxxExxY protein